MGNKCIVWNRKSKMIEMLHKSTRRYVSGLPKIIALGLGIYISLVPTAAYSQNSAFRSDFDPIEIRIDIYNGINEANKLLDRNPNEALSILLRLTGGWRLQADELAILDYEIARAYAETRKPYEVLARLEQSIKKPLINTYTNGNQFLLAARTAEKYLSKEEYLETVKYFIGLYASPTAEMYKVLGHAFFLNNDYNKAIQNIELALKTERNSQSIEEVPWQADLEEAYKKAGKRQNVETDKSGRDESAGVRDRDYSAVFVVLPEYPKAVIKSKAEGHVDLRFTISKNGMVENVLVLDSKPMGFFDFAALGAIKGFKYVPRIVNGQVVETPDVRARFVFQLSDMYK